MHRSLTANALLTQIMFEQEADLAIISEQYNTIRDNTWLEDSTKTAAIWIMNAEKFQTTSSGIGDGFVWISSSDYTVNSFKTLLTTSKTQLVASAET